MLSRTEHTILEICYRRYGHDLSFVFNHVQQRRDLCSSNAVLGEARPQQSRRLRPISALTDGSDAGERDARRQTSGLTDSRINHPRPIFLKPYLGPTLRALPPPSEPVEDPPSEPIVSQPSTITLANLPADITKRELRSVLSRYGAIKDMSIHLNGADVTYEDSTSTTKALRAYAEDAIRLRDRAVIMFRQIATDKSEPDAEKAPKEESHSLSPQDDYPAIIVSRFNALTTVAALREVFEPFGEIKRIVFSAYIVVECFLFTHQILGSDMEEARIVYPSTQDMKPALEAHRRTPFLVRGTRVMLRWEAQPRPGRSEQVYPVSGSLTVDDLYIPGFRASCPPARSIWLGGFDPSITDTELLPFFTGLGPLVGLRTSG
ncbi:hypothetical protein BV25DRAFT_771527 [Artomyces pyxidatus]|uniref:Uncharacterized protein n=1 Tax=Artomyces pyxidatus TaxID=48021 RepID=A0ACB8SXN6_9AGAM|nr:hypothetical protein BV25DRAFT_771527 [Artomyces pyxidatus]